MGPLSQNKWVTELSSVLDTTLGDTYLVSTYYVQALYAPPPHLSPTFCPLILFLSNHSLSVGLS